ncbi:MAG: DUF3109 family protein [Dysgonamonadaceae bacterium]|jgi:hypothetical protein|nr:DUF3109 family protein [Dysgonamonadaceae bacterium]
MLIIDNTLVSESLLDECFCCDLPLCKGICCVEGESGAPVEESEIPRLEEVLPIIRDSLSPEAQKVIDSQGVVYIDSDGDYVTSIVDGKDCVFTCYDEEGICRCAIEKAFREGKTDFFKPVSCHLYPVRVDKMTEYEAVNYHRWPVCDEARKCGKRLNLKVWQFLREPLIRKFGEEWYSQLQYFAEKRQ